MRALLRRVLIHGIAGALLAAGFAYVYVMNDFLSSVRFTEVYGLPVTEQTIDGWLAVDQRLSGWFGIVATVGAVGAVSLGFMVRMSLIEQ